MMKTSTLAGCAGSTEIIELAETLGVVSDVNRLRILCLLFNGEKCVCEIERELGISQPLASHHLGVLKRAGLVEVRKQNTNSFYSLRRKAMKSMNSNFLKFLGADRMTGKRSDGAACKV